MGLVSINNCSISVVPDDSPPNDEHLLAPEVGPSMARKEDPLESDEEI
jgi:hypothetical protein